MKTKFLALIGGLGGLCVLCCTLPLFGILGFASIEAFVCENRTLQVIGASVAMIALFFIAKKFWPSKGKLAAACATDCGCKST